MTKDTSPFQFPCEYPLKVMGWADSEFEGHVIGIVRRHVPDLGEGAITSRASKAGKYVSLTITIQAQSKDQLDKLYRDLTSHPKILMAL